MPSRVASRRRFLLAAGYFWKPCRNAALHTCFLCVNLLYFMQITWEIHSQNNCVKRYMQNYTRKYTQISETWCKVLHRDCVHFDNFYLWLKSVKQRTTISCPQTVLWISVILGKNRMIVSLTSSVTKLLPIWFNFVQFNHLSLLKFPQGSLLHNLIHCTVWNVSDVFKCFANSVSTMHNFHLRGKLHPWLACTCSSFCFVQPNNDLVRHMSCGERKFILYLW